MEDCLGKQLKSSNNNIIGLIYLSYMPKHSLNDLKRVNFSQFLIHNFYIS